MRDWKTKIGFDNNSLSGDPAFVNAAGADGIRGAVGGVDHGADDDFSLQTSSPALNRGDLTASYFKEPVGSGGDGDRIDIGATGGTTSANPGPAQLVQVLGSTGDQRYTVGQPTTISFRSAGLTAQDPVLFVDAAGGAVQGSETWNVWQANSYTAPANTTTYTASSPINANGLDIPAAVLNNMQVFYTSTNPVTKYNVPLADGTYHVTLVFADNQSTAVGQRVFDILGNGVTYGAKFDPFKSAGAANKATTFSFDITTTGGTGLALGLKEITGAAILNGIEITRTNLAASVWTASADVSYDNGQTWTNVANGLSLDQFGSGSFSFTPGVATNGFAGLLRLTATDGVHTVVDQSQGAFMVAPSGNTYYVNDGSTAGDVYTTAVGNDNNTGKTANNPMASLAALLNVYKLQPGDIVYVDSGTYTLPTEITFGATQSGTAANPIRIVGAGATTILDRGTIASNASVFRFAGGHDISIESMVLKEGGSTVNVLANSGSTDVSLKGLDISGFSTDAVNVGAGDGGFSLTGSNIHDATGPTSVDGIDLDSVVNATVSGNTISRTRYGIYANNTFSLTISGNLFNLDVTGVEAYQSAYTADNSSIVNILGNIVTGSLGTGIDISASYGTATVRGNTISGATSSFGLTSGGYVNVDSNELFNNSGGIQVGYFNTVTNNNVHDNLTYGILRLRNVERFREYAEEQ